jgi:hypothetical protein
VAGSAILAHPEGRPAAVAAWRRSLQPQVSDEQLERTVSYSLARTSSPWSSGHDRRHRARRARRPAGARADQVALDRLIEEGGDGPGGDRVGDQGADEAGSGGPHDGLRLVDADGDPDDVRYGSELVR